MTIYHAMNKHTMCSNENTFLEHDTAVFALKKVFFKRKMDENVAP